jgi:hypothetical protein
MSEQRLTCVDCGRDFEFSAEEQAFFREKGFNPPKRCKECRQAKKAQRGQDDRGGGGRR